VKKTWQEINNLLNKKRKTKHTITQVKRPNNCGITKDPCEISNIFNKHFATVGDKLTSQLPSSKRAYHEYLKSPTPSGSFSFSPITPEEIQNEIELLSYNKAYGLYSFPTRILKCAQSVLSIPLSRIMNRSIEIGKYTRVS
jgi:hypothetical protein